VEFKETIIRASDIVSKSKHKSV